MASASASTSASMRAKGGSARGFRGRAGARGTPPRPGSAPGPARERRPSRRPRAGNRKGAAARRRPARYPETRPARRPSCAAAAPAAGAFRARAFRAAAWRSGRGGRGGGLPLAPRRGADALEQFLERPRAQVLRVVERRAARRARDLFVVRAVREQPLQRLLPRPDVLRGHLRHGHHLLVHARLVALDGAHRHQVGHAHLGFGDAAHVARHHRHAAQHGFEHHARARLGPQRRRQQHARARQQLVDVVHRREHVHVGARRRARRGPAHWCPRWGRRRTARAACVRRAPGRRRCPSPRTGSRR